MDLALRSALVGALVLAGGVARAETPIVTLGDSFRINGYSSLEFEKQIGDEGRGDPNGSFDADLFDIVLNWRGSDRLRVAADVTWEHGTASEDGRGNAALEYGFAEYSFSDALRVRAGKLFTPFGIYNEIHTAKPAFLTVKEPLATNKADKFGGAIRLFPRWITGVAVLGNGPIADGEWSYVVAVSNGEQFANDLGELAASGNPYEEDLDKAKAITARGRVTLFHQLDLGASLYADTMTILDSAGDPLAGSADQLTWGVEATWRVPAPALTLEVEIVGSRFKPSPALEVAAAADSLPLAEVSSLGLSAMVSWAATEKLTPYARFETFDPDADADDDRANLFIAGVNYQVGGGLVLKGEVDYLKSGIQNARFGPGEWDYVEVKAAAVVGF